MGKLIGIDPGKSTGVAIAENGRLSELLTTDFWGAVDIINANSDASFVIELPKNKRVHHKGAVNRGAIERTGVNVGSVIREAELLIDYVKRSGRQLIVKAPQQTKFDAEKFKNITGWVGRCNQHERDASMLIYWMSK